MVVSVMVWGCFAILGLVSHRVRNGCGPDSIWLPQKMKKQWVQSQHSHQLGCGVVRMWMQSCGKFTHIFFYYSFSGCYTCISMKLQKLRDLSQQIASGICRKYYPCCIFYYCLWQRYQFTMYDSSCYCCKLLLNIHCFHSVLYEDNLHPIHSVCKQQSILKP